MNIHFFGHSATKSQERPYHKKTFYDMVMQHYSTLDIPEFKSDGKYKNYYGFSRGFVKCSEERILFFLKKTENINIAVIFHGDPQFVFIPTMDHDFRNSEIDKWDLEYHKEVDRYYLQYNNITNKFPNSVDDGDPIHWSKVQEILLYNRENFYHRDIQLNRYYGALVQIDQFITAKKIKTIHCIHREYIPSWFKFSSGIVDTELITYQYSDTHSMSYAKSSNGITPLGNRLIADRLIEYIEQLRKE